MNYWKGNNITELHPHEVFVFGSNPQGRHGLGAAKAAMKFGAKYGKGRGLQGQSYALVTKNLKCGYREPNGKVYHKIGEKSVSLVEIIENLKELAEVARENPNKEFLIAYKANTRFLNGYSAKEMHMCFMEAKLPDNVLIHESFKYMLQTVEAFYV